MSEEAGVVYILSNPAMPGLVKLGKTTNLLAGLKSLYSTGVPLSFHSVFAKKVGNYHEVEHKLHARLRSHKDNESREFFRIAEEEVINFLKQTNLSNFLFVSMNQAPFCARRTEAIPHRGSLGTNAKTFISKLLRIFS